MRYDKPGEFSAAESEAREHRRGLRADPHPERLTVGLGHRPAVHWLLSEVSASKRGTAMSIHESERQTRKRRIDPRLRGGFPLPPLAEQKRIVASVELLLARVNAAREHLTRMPPILKRFRQSVLAAACSGQLTADWRESNPSKESSHELLAVRDTANRKKWELLRKSKTYQPPIRPQIELIADESDLPEQWAWASPDELCDSIVDCPHSTPKWADEGEICLRTTNFRPGALDLTVVRFVSPKTVC